MRSIPADFRGPSRGHRPLGRRVTNSAVLVGLLLLSLGGSDFAFAASYQQQNGSVVDPIHDIFLNIHPYVGPDLAPGVGLDGVQLRFADLDSADLAGVSWVNADLESIDLDHADLSSANLTDAVLVDATLRFTLFSGTQLSGADFSGADFANAIDLGASLGPAFYSPDTDFALTGFDPVEAGWVLVPEPSAALLFGMGLMGLALARQRMPHPELQE